MTSGTRGNPARPLARDAFMREETYAATRLPVEQASTLIPDAYTSADFFAMFGTPFASGGGWTGRASCRERVFGYV